MHMTLEADYAVRIVEFLSTQSERADAKTISDETQVTQENAIPSFEITKQVTYKFYYDDLYSLVFRMRMYKYNGVKNLAFWRLGQEETDVWNYIKTK